MFKEKLDEFLDKYSEAEGFSGAVRVTVKDEIIYERGVGYADIEKKIPITRDTLFTFYSMTKPFTAIGVMLLCDEGLVSLDAHPSLYVPEASGVDSRVTIRMLLQHTSGIPDFEQNDEFRKEHMPGSPDQLRDHLRLITEYPQRFEPGTQKFYANVNYIILALIIENLSGMKYADYMMERVIRPLGMKSAFIDNTSPRIEGGAIGYDKAENGSLCAVDRGRSWMYGAGDIVGTLDDAYALNLSYKNKLLLSEWAWNEILTVSEVSGMGLGNTVNIWHGKRRITHNGGHYGFRTLHAWLPDYDFDIILLSNCGFGDARVQVGNAIHEAYFGSDDGDTEEIKMDVGYIKNA